MKTKKQITADVTKYFKSIETNEISIFNEILLILNLRRAAGNYTDEFKLLSLIETLKGESFFEDWDKIIKECKNYITNHPKPNTDNPYDYIYQVVNNSSISRIILLNDDDILLFKLSSISEKSNLLNLHNYLCYVYIKDYLMTTMNVKDAVYEFTNNILLNNNDIYPYIHAYKIINIDFENTQYLNRLYNFNEAVNSLKDIMDDIKRFDSFFYDLTGETFDNYNDKVEELDRISQENFNKKYDNN
jgi:hypothetical protein